LKAGVFSYWPKQLVLKSGIIYNSAEIVKMQYWLMKSEPGELSIDDLAQLPGQTIEWFGIRNYQARNFMRDQMQIGDLALFWHSSCKDPGIYGIVKIATMAHPDSFQFNPQSEYYEPSSTLEQPRWWCVDVQFVQKTPYLAISELRKFSQLQELKVLQKGNRLSITPVTKSEWLFIQDLINN
jgi:predicted RNA-binding protein with PUA-like domain